MSDSIECIFSGGRGSAQTNSYSQHLEIPVDNYGTVFYSNLKTNKKPEGQEDPSPVPPENAPV